MSTVDISRIKADLKRLQDQETELRDRVMGLQAERNKLEAALEILKRYGLTDDTSHAVGMYEGMTIADAVEEYLKRVGGTGRVTAIRDDLVSAGMLTGKPESRYGTLIQTMQRHKTRFEKVAPGVWHLMNYIAVGASAPTDPNEPSPAFWEAVRELDEPTRA